jgi:hypothetical protein
MPLTRQNFLLYILILLAFLTNPFFITENSSAGVSAGNNAYAKDIFSLF